jgi:hypothetical protein
MRSTPHRSVIEFLFKFSIITSFAMSISTYDHANKLEESNSSHLEHIRTAGGYIDDRSQPALPVVHRSLANPAPLGLLSFATGIFLISMLGGTCPWCSNPERSCWRSFVFWWCLSVYFWYYGKSTGLAAAYAYYRSRNSSPAILLEQQSFHRMLPSTSPTP